MRLSLDWIVTSLVVLAGIVILSYSLAASTRIVGEFHEGLIKRRWKALRLLILLFILGYLGYIFLALRSHFMSELVVALIFFAGSLFVLLVCSLTLNTVKDINCLDILRTQNITDDLTGIYNRRHLERCLELEVSRARHLGLPLSVLMLDLDHYKEINDKYGHQAGDQILKCIGNLLQQVTRRLDIVARFGGDEFVILLPNTDQVIAWDIADRIRLTVQGQSAGSGAECCKVKGAKCAISIGVASLSGDETDGNQILHMADAALYQAKESGRNCVVMYRTGMAAHFLKH